MLHMQVQFLLRIYEFMHENVVSLEWIYFDGSKIELCRK